MTASDPTHSSPSIQVLNPSAFKKNIAASIKHALKTQSDYLDPRIELVGQMFYLWRKHGVIEFSQRGMAKYFLTEKKRCQRKGLTSERAVRYNLADLEAEGALVKVEPSKAAIRAKRKTNRYFFRVEWLEETLGPLFASVFASDTGEATLLKKSKNLKPNSGPFDPKKFREEQLALGRTPGVIEMAIHAVQGKRDIDKPWRYARVVAKRQQEVWRTRTLEQEEAKKNAGPIDKGLMGQLKAKIGNLFKPVDTRPQLSVRQQEHRLQRKMEAAQQMGWDMASDYG